MAKRQVVSEQAYDPSLGDRPIRTIDSQDASRFIEHVSTLRRVTRDGTQIATRGAAAELRKWGSILFEWARGRHKVDANPFAGASAPAGKKRDRFSRMDEAQAVWAAAGSLPRHWAHSVRLLLLTGCREMEICGAQLQWLDQDAAEIIVPAAFYKTKRSFLIALSDPAASIVREIPRGKGPFLLTGKSLSQVCRGRCSTCCTRQPNLSLARRCTTSCCMTFGGH